MLFVDFYGVLYIMWVEQIVSFY